MTLRCCWLIQPASATSTNRNGYDGGVMALRLSKVMVIGSLAPAPRAHAPAPNRRSALVSIVFLDIRGRRPPRRRTRVEIVKH
jgi:hypothetical protein